MAESNDYKTFKLNVPLPHDRVDRIENGVGVGMFDVNYCFSSVEGWIELKSPVEPKRPTTKLFGSNHKVSQDQANWCLRQIKAGGRAFVLIATDKRWMLIDGRQADRINELTVSELLELSCWSATKPVRDNESWKLLRAKLIAG